MFPKIVTTEFDMLPFSYFIGNCKLPSGYASWLDWQKKEAPWVLTATDFYEQYEFSVLNAAQNRVDLPLTKKENLSSIRDQMARHFNCVLSDRIDVTAHKLLPQQTIRIHNDFILGGESHRLLLQLNPDWLPEYGGYLMFFGGPDPESVCKIVEPIDGSVQAFAISPYSYHAVSTVHGGERITIVYSFYPGDASK